VRYITTEENLQSRIEQAERQIESIQSQIRDATTASVQNSIDEVIVQIEDLQNEINDLESKIANIDPLFATAPVAMILMVVLPVFAHPILPYPVYVKSRFPSATTSRMPETPGKMISSG